MTAIHPLPSMQMRLVIERLEINAEPSRVLDEAIASVVGELPPLVGPGAWKRHAPGAFVLPFDGQEQIITLPRWTENLDDALRLIPAHHEWQVGSNYACVWPSKSRMGDTEIVLKRKLTPAQTLSIAALRARLALMEADEQRRIRLGQLQQELSTCRSGEHFSVHALAQCEERCGILPTPEEAEQAYRDIIEGRAIDRGLAPDRMAHDYIVRIRGHAIPVVYVPADDKVVTVIPQKFARLNKISPIPPRRERRFGYRPK